MPDQSPVLALPMIQPAQAQKHITHNEALLVLDALVQLSVESHDSAAPPDNPAPGTRYIVGQGATGAWAGQDGAVALRNENDWRFFTPQAGWRADHGPSGTVLRHDGTAWQEAGGGGQVDMLGIGGATPDAVNRLAVTSDAVLLSHDAAGDHRLKVNRASAADTASLLFQTGFSGGAEMGLAGSGDWSVKVSPDGAAWTEALAFDAASGAARGAAVQSDRQDMTPDRLATVAGTYGPASLIGTVSDTDGLPGGAVMESGAGGTGGHYLRLADGSQVCWGTLTGLSQDISTASGGAVHGAPMMADFAAPFAMPPSLTVTEQHLDGTADIWALVSDLTTTGFSALPMALSARTQDRMIHYVARGLAPGVGLANTTGAPVISGTPAISGTATEGQTLAAIPADVSGIPAPTRTWQWLRSGDAIAGATSGTYVAGAADVGQTLSVVQTETNGDGTATAQSDPTAAISAGGLAAATGGTIADITDPANGLEYRVHTFTDDGTFDVTTGGDMEYLIVAGGGAGGGYRGGGGGAGGLLSGVATVTAGVKAISVGDGGLFGSDERAAGADGGDSSALGLTAAGGGGGGGIDAQSGRDGGSGGGGAAYDSDPGGTGSPGNDGGTSSATNGRGAGGGAGAGADGGDGTPTTGGHGGDGAESNGTATHYAGGGSGWDDITPGTGGAGGGGAANVNGNGTPGTPNTGGGGGGGSSHSGDRDGGDGGSGIVIIRYRR